MRPLILACLLALSLVQPLGAAPETKDALLVAFLFNFGKFADWPETVLPQQASQIRYCLWGDNSIAEALATLEDKPLGEMGVVTKRATDAGDLHDCQVLYVSKNKWREHPDAWQEITEKPILTVAMNSGFADNKGIIELFVRDNRLRFRINNEQAQRVNLSLDAGLLQLATEVF